MKVIIFTTQTTHHAYFVQMLLERFSVDRVYLEEKHVHPTFETRHAFEDVRDRYECDVFFNGRNVRIKDIVPAESVYLINDWVVYDYVKKENPDCVIVFGTGKINERLISVCRGNIVNLHGGDPQIYRGLDSHLWSIYNQDFDALVTTLHIVNPVLDDGQIIAQKKLFFPATSELYELRRINTQACVDLTADMLVGLERTGEITSFPQVSVGKYYSFMPVALKETCIHIFSAFMERQKGLHA